MLITKFNKLIHNKLLWGVFAVLISVAFLFSFGAGSKGCSDDTPSGNAVGTLFGEDVTSREFFFARFFELGLRRNVNLPAESEALLRQRVWERLAALRTAEKAGIRVSDREIAEAIQQDGTFARNGQFDKAQYQGIVQQQLGIDVLTFEEYLRQELTLEKLRETSAAFAWASPYEVDQSLGELTEQRTVEYVVLPSDTMTPQMTISTNDVKAYFDENQAAFEVPEKVSVVYVKLDLTNYMDEVEIRETNVVEYYNENIETYTTTDTNEQDIVTPLVDVQDDIRAQLEHETTLNLAMTEATEFVVSLVPGRFTAAIPFETACSNAGLAIATSELFSVDREVPGLNVGPAFRKAAFDLDADDDDLRFSDAIPEEDAVYVLAANERIEAHIPEFEAVKAAVFPITLTNAQSEAFSKRAATIRERLESATKSGRSFTDAAGLMDLNVSTTMQFTVYEGMPEGSEYGNVIPTAVMPLGQGELSEVVPVDVGYLIARVAASEPGDITAGAMIRPQLAGSLQRYRGGMAYRAWTQAMLTKADFKDYVAESMQAALEASENEEDDE